MLVTEVDRLQLQAAFGGKRGRILAAVAGVLTDAETDVQTVGLVAELEQDVPDRERVLAAAHRHEHALARLEHPEVLDRLLDLAPAQLEQVVAAEVGVVARQVDDRRLAAHAALTHCSPSRDDRADLDRVGIVQTLITGNQCAVADDQVRLSVQSELVEEPFDRA